MIAEIRTPVVSFGGLSPLTFNDEYVRRLREADPEVEQHFIAYFSRLLLLKLRASIRSEELIEDICQCTFLRVFERLRTRGGIDHPERLAAFVLGVSNNVLREMVRKEHRLAPLEEGEDPPDERIDSTGDLVNDERKRLVNRILGELSTKDRGILNMLFIEEASKDSICMRFGIDRDYLRVLVFRARGRFRNALLESDRRGHEGKAPLVKKKGAGHGS
jgi:RNA polymerase sigma-70 factor (ECF subfamily)